MKRVTGLVVTLLLLGYGLIRIGVGGALLAQALEWINFTELAAALSEMKLFLDARASKQLLYLSLAAFNAYIVVMGALLATGAAGIIYYKRWGFVLLGIYLAMHAALFINYQEFSFNRKVVVLALQCVLLVVLVYLRPPGKVAQKSNKEVVPH